MKTPQFLLACLALHCSLGLAEDAYYHVPLTSLTLSEGKLPTNAQWNGAAWQMAEALQPYAVLDADGEAYISGEAIRPWTQPLNQNQLLTLRAPKGQTRIVPRHTHAQPSPVACSYPNPT